MSLKSRSISLLFALSQGLTLCWALAVAALEQPRALTALFCLPCWELGRWCCWAGAAGHVGLGRALLQPRTAALTLLVASVQSVQCICLRGEICLDYFYSQGPRMWVFFS